MILFVILSFVDLTIAGILNMSESCLDDYRKGVDAYLDYRYIDCVQEFESALETHNVFRKNSRLCRLNCNSNANSIPQFFRTDIDDLQFYERTIKKTLCLIDCYKIHRDDLKPCFLVSKHMKIFEDRKIYEYLHVCYFQINMRQKAASSAFTYLVTNPNDDVMQQVFKYYMTLHDVNVSNIVNFEAKDFVYMYTYGMIAYGAKHWSEVRNFMEDSLNNYIQAEEECRADCEDRFGRGWHYDFILSIASHFTSVLRCKRKCRKLLSTLNGEKHDDLLPNHYNYLQFAYFKLGNTKAACECVASYLLFHPQDETMLYNYDYYKKLPNIDESFFTPRQEAEHYVRRDVYEETLMNFVSNEFDANRDRKESNKHLTMYKERKKNIRVVTDSFITYSDCSILLNLLRKYARPGDGYKGSSSPHTKHEELKGLSLEAVSSLASSNLLDQHTLHALLNILQSIKQRIVQHFRVRKLLHFAFTHLVCRTAITIRGKHSPEDMSHPFHADNCNVESDGSCSKKAPAFVWRDYTAIVYLNNDFAGGELLFVDNYVTRNIQDIVKPSCGRLVAFTAGVENLHGVRAVLNGSRCALAVWFTHDRHHIETGHRYIETLLNKPPETYLLCV